MSNIISSNFFLSDLQGALRDILSDNYHKRTQTNTVVVQQKEMDRVGVEPTTSAMKSRRLSYSKVAFRLATDRVCGLISTVY